MFGLGTRVCLEVRPKKGPRMVHGTEPETWEEHWTVRMTIPVLSKANMMVRQMTTLVEERQYSVTKEKKKKATTASPETWSLE